MASASDPIDRINADAEAIAVALTEAKQVSLQVTADVIFRRAIVMAIGGYFENRIVSAVERFCSSRSNNDPELCAFVKNKALSRQYHTLFDWNARNANQFLKLFGDRFKETFLGSAKRDSRLEDGIGKFMHLGGLRNTIAHGPFSEISLDQSRDEIMRDYRMAMVFIECVERALGV